MHQFTHDAEIAAPGGAPTHPTVIHAFEQQVADRPGAIAVTHGGRSTTYGELSSQADELAARLASVGVGPGDRVALVVTRSAPMVVAIVATLRLGAAYVPQDARIVPPAHLEHIVDVAGCAAVVTMEEHLDRVGTASLRVPVVVADRPSAAEAPPPPRRMPVPADVAVVIFTSGTTGVPNGVAVTHGNLANVLLTEPGSLGMQPGMRVAQLLNVAFDMAAWEILGALSHGAELVVRGRDVEATVGEVDVVIATPGVLAGVDPSRCRRVSVVAVAGERCPLPLAEAWSAFARFHNCCGPTEVTIVNTISTYEHGSGRLTIGAPVPGTTVYVLDDDLRPVGPGEVGEMWAGGACVTQGYVGNPVLTEERYRPDPFLGGDHRMFRTRDLGRWTADGELEHLGRTDDQVKVRGFRVELDGVTTALERTTGCTQATTALVDGRLVAFVAPATVDVAAARRSVAHALPYYCVPDVIVALDRLPTTSRGKIDKRALGRRVGVAPVAASTQVAGLVAVA